MRALIDKPATANLSEVYLTKGSSRRSVRTRYVGSSTIATEVFGSTTSDLAYLAFEATLANLSTLFSTPHRSRCLGKRRHALLEAIEAKGSITAAARSLQISYRYAWLSVQSINDMLCDPAVMTDRRVGDVHPPYRRILPPKTRARPSNRCYDPL
jgi:hypothetical protein